MHFRSGIGGDSQITTTAYNIIADLDALEAMIKGKGQNLEASLTQIENYQKQMQDLKRRILQEEQQLRLIMAPTYLPGDRDKAASEQQVRDTLLFRTSCHLFRSYIFSIHSFDYVRFTNSSILVTLSNNSIFLS